MAETTLAQIRAKIKNDLDLNEETFITDTEIDSLINAGIRDVEAEIHGLYEDYYFTFTTISLVNGTSTYDLPTDIYADKVRSIQYNDGSSKYEIKRIRDISIIPYIGTGDDYSYMITNSTSAGRKIKLYPASRETNSTNVNIYYIRKAKELSSDSDSCDIPVSFLNYVFWRVKLSIYEKESSPMSDVAAKEVADAKDKMIATLSNRVPDDDNKILPNFDYYEDLA